MELSLLRIHPREQLLFHHYIDYVTSELSPPAGFVCSAYAAIVPSIAISGQVSTASQDAGIAVFHGVCGVAATNLSTICSDNSLYRLEALHHERLALRHLRKSIESGTDAYLVLAVAIMMLLLFEHLSGRAQEYRAHIQAGIRCLVLSEQKISKNNTASVISEQFLLACALGNIIPDVSIESLRRNLTDGRPGNSEGQAGMALEMLDIIISINECYAHHNEVGEEEVERLGERLKAHSPRELELSGEVSTNQRTGAFAFHGASIYYVRAVRRLSASHSDTIWAVEQGIRELEAMQPTGRELNNCVIAWATYIIGSECSLPNHKARFLTWCASDEAKELMDLTAITMVSQHTWKTREHSPEMYRPLSYMFSDAMDGVWYPDQEGTRNPFGILGMDQGMDDLSLKDTLGLSKELSSTAEVD